MKKQTESALGRALAGKLVGLMPAPATANESDYDRAMSGVSRKLPLLREQVERDRERIADRYADLADQPKGRRATVIRNGSTTMLTALAFDLMRRSYADRFERTARSLKLANLAHEVAQSVVERGQPSPVISGDLLGESLCYLGNARRINSDVIGAGKALAEARIQLDSGTRDRQLRALQLSFLATLRHTEGRGVEAAELYDREIRLRELLGDPEALGAAFINRGLVACWTGEPRTAASRFIVRGIKLAENEQIVFLGILCLAEAPRRDELSSQTG